MRKYKFIHVIIYSIPFNKGDKSEFKNCFISLFTNKITSLEISFHERRIKINYIFSINESISLSFEFKLS